MDGNRRFASKSKLGEGMGHTMGFLALLSMLKFCHELGVKHVTVYAFSIDNFRRRPEEVMSLMDLMQEKIEGLLEEESIVNRYGVRVYFSGDLRLLTEPVRLAAERVMLSTANNSRTVLSICVAYSSTNEIVHSIQESCERKKSDESSLLDEKERAIKLSDIEKHMYMAASPDPDILIRTAAEKRLSNFLLWQSAFCHLYAPSVYWPEISFRHFVWGILKFQRNHFYFEKKKKTSISMADVS
ncbi:hypothetical protein ACFE04_031761 [Oxalis oulophora]